MCDQHHILLHDTNDSSNLTFIFAIMSVYGYYSPNLRKAPNKRGKIVIWWINNSSNSCNVIRQHTIRTWWMRWWEHQRSSEIGYPGIVKRTSNKLWHQGIESLLHNKLAMWHTYYLIYLNFSFYNGKMWIIIFFPFWKLNEMKQVNISVSGHIRTDIVAKFNLLQGKL